MTTDVTRMLLPIGSVVLLADGEGTWMVISRMEEDEGGRVWDYLGCPYPGGCGDGSGLMAFDRRHVGVLLFIGYQNADEVEMREALEPKASSREVAADEG